jgi:pimeloyl-ACP methyl ester carboxylesterase
MIGKSFPIAARALLAAAAFAAAGCEEAGPPRLRTSGGYVNPDRLANGLVIILPGIEGESAMNHGIREGIVSSGTGRAVAIHLWGSPIPGISMFINQTNVLGNRLAGKRVADMVVAYQDANPGRPVHIIGHSGGGGVAVFAAESMPEGRQVDGIILLSASISAGYDMSKALTKCKSGAVNFYCRADVGLLVIGTTLFGNVDGVRGPATGNSGFTNGHSKLYELELTPEMTVGDPHAAATRAGFVQTYVAPWVASAIWPPTGGALGRAHRSAGHVPTLASADRPGRGDAP